LALNYAEFGLKPDNMILAIHIICHWEFTFPCQGTLSEELSAK